MTSSRRVRGAWLAAAIEGLGLPQVAHVRGRGLLRGIVLTENISREVALEEVNSVFQAMSEFKTMGFHVITRF